MQPFSKTPDAMPAQDHPVSLFAKIVIVSFVYALAGIVTLYLGFAEGYAAPFWPGAGLGLTALLIWGRQCWPGILLGSFLVDLWVDSSIGALPMASINATASTLQALIAASLVHKLIKRPESLAKDTDLLKFLLFAGPLSCVIASTVGVLSRYGFGSLPAEDLRAEWLIWWAGDTLGVLLFTPVILLLWQDRRARVLQVGSHRIVFPLVITAALLLSGNYALARLEQNRSQLELERVFDEISDLRFETLPGVIQPLIQLERFFSSSIRVWPSEFARFTQFMISEPAMIAIDWAPRVPAGQLEVFERNELQLLDQAEHIFEIGSPFQGSVLAERSEYFPVLFSEPSAEGGIALGLDHGYETPRLEAMQQASQTGRPVMSQIVPLLRTSKQGVLVFNAVYEQGRHPLLEPDLADTELQLKGFVVGVYDIAAWLQPLLDVAQDKGMLVRISDVTHAGDHHVFWTDLADSSHPAWTRDLDIAGRSWRLEMQPEAPVWKPGASLEEQLYLAFSVVAAFMAVFATLGSAGRYAATRGEVATRTKELREELHTRQAIEQALQESESRYRNLIEAAPFTILLQHRGKVVYLNSQGLKTFGADSLEQVVDFSILELVQPDHRGTIQERIRRISAGETLSEMVTLTCLRLDSTPFEAEWSSVPYEMDDGFGSLVVLQDVTARKNAEEQLDRFFSLSLDLLCIADEQGYFRRVNPAFTQLLGWSEKELLSRPFYNLIHPEDLDATIESVAHINSGERANLFKNRYLCKNGSWRWLEWKALSQPNGLIYASAHDVTLQHEATEQLQLLNDKLHLRIEERSAALKALNAKEQEIEAVLNNLLECVITIDTSGRIRRVNPAVTSVFGYTAEEVVGQNIAMLMPEPHRSQHDNYLKNYQHTGVAKLIGSSRELEGLHKDGTLIPLELAVSEYFINDQVYYTGTLRDISERRSLIYELINARVEAEESSHAKSAFLATMSHEIRTPMNGVLGLVDVLDRDELSHYQKGLVKTIKRSARSLLTIIDDILDFSKIEAGRLEICNESVDVGELVEELCSSLVLLALDKQVDLSVFIDPSLPRMMLADSTRLRQVLYNLVGNAIKFSGNRDEKRGLVLVRVEQTDQQPPQLQIAIIDNGIGIAEDRLDELFDPFNQAESDTTRRFGGTGLGLTISKRLVEMMQGVIRVQSTPGEGSRFIVELPLQAQMDETQQSSFWPDLSGVSCVLTPADSYRAEDLAIYLQAAGAVTVQTLADESLQQLLACQTPPVVLITNGVDVMPSLEGMLASMPHVRQLRIVHGRRRKARVEDAEHVLLDGDALSREALLQAVSISAGYLSPVTGQPYLATDQLELLHKEGEPDRIPIKGQQILVAEDDEINQIVILQQLRLLGYTSEIAENGREALDMWRTGRFSLLLTDLHMPEIDGYQLTEKIRAEETEGQHIPIIALTANALRGESERARQAGIDVYLVKPIALKKLQAALDEWLPVEEEEQEPISMSNTSITPQDKTLSILDSNVLKELLGDDRTITDELLRDYLDSANKHTARLMAAWQQRDLNEIEMVAHKLKSSSRSVGALKLGELCAVLELAVRSNRLTEVEACLKEFAALFALTRQHIDRYLGSADDVPETDA